MSTREADVIEIGGGRSRMALVAALIAIGLLGALAIAKIVSAAATKPPAPAAVPSPAAPQSPVSLSAGGPTKWGVLPDGTFFLTVGVSAPSADLGSPVVTVGPIKGLTDVTGGVFSGLVTLRVR